MFDHDDKLADDLQRPRAARPLPDWWTSAVESHWIDERGMWDATILVRGGCSLDDLERLWAERQAKARYRATATVKRVADEAASPLLAELRKAKARAKTARANVKRARERVEQAELAARSGSYLLSSTARALVNLPGYRETLAGCEATLAKAEADVQRIEAQISADH